MRRFGTLLFLMLMLAGCGLTPGQGLIIGLSTAEALANTSIINMTDQELADHRQLIVDVKTATMQADSAVGRHLSAIDAEIARRSGL